MDNNEIYKYLRDMRNRGITNTTSATYMLKYLTKKEGWSYEQCQIFYEAILRHYISEQGSLDHMLAVSGLKDGYRSQEWYAAERRARYLDHLQKQEQTSVGTQALEKREKKWLLEIAEKMENDINCKEMERLLNEWLPELASSSELSDYSTLAKPNSLRYFFKSEWTGELRHGVPINLSDKLAVLISILFALCIGLTLNLIILILHFIFHLI